MSIALPLIELQSGRPCRRRCVLVTFGFYYRAATDFRVRFLSSIFPIYNLHNPLSYSKSSHNKSLAGGRTASSIPCPILQSGSNQNRRQDPKNPLAPFVHVVEVIIFASYSPMCFGTDKRLTTKRNRTKVRSTPRLTPRDRMSSNTPCPVPSIVASRRYVLLEPKSS